MPPPRGLLSRTLPRTEVVHISALSLMGVDMLISTDAYNNVLRVAPQARTEVLDVVGAG